MVCRDHRVLRVRELKVRQERREQREPKVFKEQPGLVLKARLVRKVRQAHKVFRD